MCDVLPFWKHKLVKWESLAHCPTCGGAEGDLPEHCPQRKMTEEERAAIYRDELDFRKGHWTTWTRNKEMRVRRMLT